MRRAGFAIESRMASRDTMHAEITPEVLLRAYACGIFPMAESADDPTLFWVEPEERGVIPARRVEGLLPPCAHRALGPLPRDRRQGVRRGDRRLRRGKTRPRQHLDQPPYPHPLYRPARLGHCHSVEVWDGDALVGGLYGVSLGGAFFGESMFHRARDASKVALVHLVARLIAGGFTLLDTQYVTEHLRSLGAIEISRRRYRSQLDLALLHEGNFARPADGPAGQRRGGAGRPRVARPT